MINNTAGSVGDINMNQQESAIFLGTKMSQEYGFPPTK